MITRLIKGLLIGVVLGLLTATALVKGIGMNPSFALAGGPLIAYTAALLTGAGVGLVAGKPIWAPGAWIEGILKTVFGALLGAGGMFLLQRFGTFSVDLTKLGAGVGTLGSLSYVALPIIATVLSVFYELDNTDPPETAYKSHPGGGKGGAAAKGATKRLRAPEPTKNADELLDEEEPAAKSTAKK